MIDPKTEIGGLSLTIPNLARSLSFYQRLGFHLLSQEANTASLGVGHTPLLQLQENPDARRVQPTTGLFHFAVLLPTRHDLARTLKNLVDQQIPVGGFSDHLVSEAIYLSDPDGNGIELYRDRPRDSWEFRPDGSMRIDTLPLDLNSLMGEIAAAEPPWTGFPDGTKIGHMHLHVRDLTEAKQFYIQTLGLDWISDYGRSASFVSAGGYHHHIGMNTWAGVGIPPNPADGIGLRWYTLRFANEAARQQTLDQLAETAVAVQPIGPDYQLQDPSGNQIRLTVGDDTF